MTKTTLAATALSLIVLVGCGDDRADSPPTVSAKAATVIAAVEPSRAAATAGSIDMAINAVTVDANSKGDTSSHQCQLNFEASNRSDVDVNSLLIEFDALPAGGGTPIGSKLTLTMPMKIPAGASQKAWGPVTVDQYACSALQLRFPPQRSFQCRTSTKAPCAPYRYSASGVALAP